MTSCRKNCQCEAGGCDMPICSQVCQCGGVTGDRRDMPEVAETCGTTGEGEDRGTKDIPDDQTDGNDGGGTKDIIPDDETDGGNATSPMQPMPEDGGDGSEDRGFSSSNNPTQSMPPVPAPTPSGPPVSSPTPGCQFFCGGGKGGTVSSRNRNDANNRNEQVGPGMAHVIESDEDESFDLSYFYDLLRKYVGYDVMMDTGSANEGTLAIASDTTNIAEANAAVKY